MPQIPMLTAHKPGIVPLRPLQLGDILDGAVKAVRFNPKSMVGLSAIVLAVFLIPSAALGVVATRQAAKALSKLGPGAEALAGYPSSLIQYFFTGLATTLLSGVLIQVVGQAVLGRKPDIGATWRSTRGRLLSLLALAFLTGLFTFLAMALLIGPGVLLLVNNNIGAGVLLTFLGLIGFIVVMVAVSTKISLAAPAIVLENHGVFAGVRRSFALTRGAFWRILGITLLAGLLAGIAAYLLELPFLVIDFVVLATVGQDTESGQVLITLLSHLSALLAGAITTPFMAAVTGLLYLDRRMRLEALDVVLLRETQTNPAPRI
jgi:membrane-anchored glycerophosphoryl diester phosphodiesterase (GDPDase)